MLHSRISFCLGKRRDGGHLPFKVFSSCLHVEPCGVVTVVGALHTEAYAAPSAVRETMLEGAENDK